MVAAESKAPLPARSSADGLILTVRLTPRAGRDDVTGVESGADGLSYLTARVKAVPEKGKANAALAALIAAWLGIPKSRCELISGGKARLKQLLLKGDAKALAEQLEKCVAELKSGV